MLDALKSLFSKDTSELSGGETAFVIIAIIVLIGAFIFIARTSFRLEKISGKPSYTIAKIIMIAVAPTIFSVLSVLNIDLPFKWFGIATVVMCVVVAVWNIITYGILGGLFFSVVHIVLGLIASFGIVLVIFIGIAAVALYLFAGGSAGGSSASSSSAPEYVRDPATGETVRVEKGANGELYVGGTSTVLRQGDYAGEYIDSNGNRYIN